MATYTVHNKGDIDGVYGQGDRLVVIYDAGILGGVSLTGLSQLADGSYSGWFDGPGDNNISFDYIRHFTFIDNAGSNDYIRFGDGDDSMAGGAGNDTLLAGAGNNTIDGGAGVDYVGADMSGYTSDISVNLNSTSSTLPGGGSISNMEGYTEFYTGSGNDSITGHATSELGDWISTGDGDDTVTLWDGAHEDYVYMGVGGNDRLVVTYDKYAGVALNGVLQDGSGGHTGWFDGPGYANILFENVENFTFTDVAGGSDYIDLRAGLGNDALYGGAGNDTLMAGAGDNTVDGGAGNDYFGVDLRARSDDITVNLNTTSALVSGTVQNVEGFTNFYTGSGNDNITNHATSELGDWISTGAGNDTATLYDGAADDYIYMGEGDDRLNVIFDHYGGVSMAGVTEDTVTGGYQGWFDGPGYDNIQFWNVEHFGFTDNFGGNDYINFSGAAGDDALYGGDGNDTLMAGAGNNTIDGGAGDDYVNADLRAQGAGVTVNLNTTSSTLPGGGSISNAEGFQSLYTGAGNDVITGHMTAGMTDWVSTGAGSDSVTLWDSAHEDHVLMGDGDSDTLSVIFDSEVGGVTLTSTASDGAGGWDGYFDGPGYANIHFEGVENFRFNDLIGGNDRIYTQDGNDTLLGGAGNDTLHAGGGVNKVNGGDGIDYFGADYSAFSSDILVDLNVNSTILGKTIKNLEGFTAFSTGSGNDTITGHQGYDMYDGITAGDGDDLITLWNGGEDTANGGLGNDRLVLINERYGPIYLTSISANVDGGYDGYFDGPGAHNVHFSSIENFSFTDGFGAADRIYTGTGDDLLVGAGGNDTLHAGSGQDTVDGGSGDDYYGADQSALTTDITVNLNTVSYVNGAEVKRLEGFTSFIAGSGNDLIIGHKTAYMYDYIEGGNGDDEAQLWTGGEDTFHGGDGNDRFTVTYDIDGPVYLTSLSGDLASGYSGWFDGPGAWNKHFSGVENFGFTATGIGNDRIYTGGGDDLLVGGAGDDTLHGGAGNNTIDGGDGNDYFGVDLSARTTGVTIDLNGVSSLAAGGTVSNVEAFTGMTGTQGNDFFTGHRTSGMSDWIDGGDGNDVFTLWAGFAEDTVIGGLGYDQLVVDFTGVGSVSMAGLTANPDGGWNGYFDGPGAANVHFNGIESFGLSLSDANDNVYLGDADDVVLGAGGNDTLTGGDGNDTLEGDTGDDQIAGNDGDDVLRGGDDNDSIWGGEGNDNIRGDAGADSMDGGAGIDTLLYTGDTVGVVIDLALNTATGGEATGDIITGFENVITGDGLDRVYGDDGNNDIRSNGGKDVLRGGLGDDTLVGGKGNDVLRGDGGADYLDGRGGNDTAVYTLDKTGIVIDLGAGTASGGEAEGDTLIGIEHIDGGKRSDKLIGSDVNNRLIGNKGNDTLLGGDGDDKLYGGAAADRILGEGGDDLLSGGDAADLFVFKPGDWDHDTLLDFEVGIDIIRITGGYSDTDVTLTAFGADTLLTLDPTGDTILFLNTAVGDLNSFADFEFV